MNVLLVLLFASIACWAEIIDRIAVVVGNGVITESEILREIRLTAFLNGDPLDFSAASRHKAAERLVEQHLIAGEIHASAYPPPASEAVQQIFKQVQGRFPDPERYAQELRRAGITEGELKEHLVRQLTTLRFLDFRFRPGIQIGEDEANQYFEQRLAPELKKTHPGVEFSIDNYRSQVEEALIGERLDQAADAWLKEARDHTRIEFRAEAFIPDPPKQEASK
jgi:peptidyl-prolyl cis-trans isomerase SurA